MAADLRSKALRALLVLGSIYFFLLSIKLLGHSFKLFGKGFAVSMLERVIAEKELQVPHPLLAARQFVLVPLLEIAPDLTLPGGARVAELADAGDPGVARWAAAPWPPGAGGERA